MIEVDKIRNLAIIAHIDHGKTTLIDSIFRDAHTFRDNARIEERVMDNHELERERGITIRAKHCTVEWNGYRINIIDTPGHADFSGEVERVLSMVDFVLLLVDANEGPMPQTRYVLMRALRLGLKPIVIINKMDRPNADPEGVLDKTIDLFIELGTSDEQIDFPVLYGSGRDGWLVRNLDKDERKGMHALFETIAEQAPPPATNMNAPFRMQISTLAWSDYAGRIGCGRVLQGRHKTGNEFVLTSTSRKDCGADEDKWEVTGSKIAKSSCLWVTRGLEREAVEEVTAGDIVWIAGAEDVMIGDTLSAPELENPALPPLDIEEPTVSTFFLVNTGPLAGQEGKAVKLRQIKERLEREIRVNVALRVEDIGRADGVKVSGRGELHLAILIEEMRREGLEFCVSQPEVITHHDSEGNLLEPMEQMIVDVPIDYQGVIIAKLARRKGELLVVHNAGTGMLRLEFKIPTRGIIGYRTEFLTDTRGLGIMSSRFVRFGPWCGDVFSRTRGSMVSIEAGEATTHSLENLQQRGTLFVQPGERVYEGMVIGEHSRPESLPCKPTKKKAMSNMRTAIKAIEAGLDVPLQHTLESALEWVADDELVEVTPKNIRIRKAILGAEDRKRALRRLNAQAG